MIPRRTFLASLVAASAPLRGWAAAGRPSLLAAAKEGGSHVLCGIREDGSLAFRLPLPARGHAGARHPDRTIAVVMARRPGTYALVIDCAGGEVVATLSPPEGLQFNGHATFLDGGGILATVEQSAATSDGVIGFWDSTTWTRLDARPSGGIGPHEVLALHDDATLVVANGGIATDPTDRSKLNLDTMEPNLAILHPDGTSTQTEVPGLQQASIRHLSLSPQGRIAFAMQWEGDPARTVPLLGLLSPGSDPVFAAAPEEETRLMQGYAGSVCWTADGATVAITSPKGGRVQIYDADGSFVSGSRAQMSVVCRGLVPGSSSRMAGNPADAGRIAGICARAP